MARAVADEDRAGTARLLVNDLAVAALLARSGPPEADLLDATHLAGSDAQLLHAAAGLGRTGASHPADLAVALAVLADAPDGSSRKDSANRAVRRATATLLQAAAAIGTGTPPDHALAIIDTAQTQVATLITVRPERRAEYTAVLATARAWCGRRSKGCG